MSISKADGFKIMSLSVFSLLGRLDQLNILIEEEKPHVIGITETKVDSSIGETDIQIERYEVVVLHCTSIEAYHMYLMHYRLESLSVQIKLGNFRPFLITAIYLPDVSLDVFREFESLVYAIDKENKESLIIGYTNRD